MKFAKLIRKFIYTVLHARKCHHWIKAAEIMTAEYSNDKELTNLTVRDDNDFLISRKSV
jgi:hypothetical protein